MDININFWSEVTFFPLLTTLWFVPLAIMVLILRSESNLIALRLGYAGTLFTVLLSFYLLIIFDDGSSSIQLVEKFQLLGMSYCVGVDGVNVLFIPLTSILSLLTLMYSSITRHVDDRKFIACLLGYEAVLMGAFTALNAMQFWFWCVLELLPLIALTSRAGTGVNRRKLITKLLQFWVSGLLMTFAGFMLLALNLQSAFNELSFDWYRLAQNTAFIHNETLIFVLLFFGFAIRMPLFPFHAWFPLLAEYGTVASTGIFLIGLKLGIYAVIRFILPVLPGVAEQWEDFVVTLGFIGIFYGALLALMQINIRRLLAFAVISHTGMLIIGVFCFNDHGLEGSILLSLSYGLATAGMLFSVGLIYERTRTAYLPRLGGLFDSNTSIGLLFLISAFSTMVMPGTPGFDAAHLLIEGTIEEHGWFIAIAILLGNVLAAAFLLWAFQRLFMATRKRFKQPARSIYYSVFQERIITVVICGLLFVTGFYTQPWLNYIAEEAEAIHEHYPVHGVHDTTKSVPATLDNKEEQGKGQ